jgi:uncharacterized protein (DUF2236 family)
MLWRICRERVILLHGPAAAVLQVCHPRVAVGVREHSDFRRAPLSRLRRTLDAVYAIAFGTETEAQRVARRLAGVHARVPGANDPELLMWVLATLIMSAVEGYERCVAKLSDDEKRQFYDEMRTFGEFFDLPGEYGPQCWRQFVGYYESMLADASIGSTDVSREVAWAVMEPARPVWLGLTNPLTHFLFSEVLPAAVRQRLGLRSNLFSRALMRWITLLSPSAVRWLPGWIRYCKQYRRALRGMGFQPMARDTPRASSAAR